MENSFGDLHEGSVYDKTKKLLIDFEFFPGDRLHVSELADQLKVSATPVREALSRLCAEGLLTSSHNRGFFVKKLDQAEIADLFAMKHLLLGRSVRGTLGHVEWEAAEYRLLSSLAQFADRKGDVVKARDLCQSRANPMWMLMGALPGNAVLLDCLRNILDRLQFVQRVGLAMDSTAQLMFSHAAVIAKGLIERDEAAVGQGLDQLYQHEQMLLPDLIKECISQLYTQSKPVPRGSECALQMAIRPA